MPVGKMPQQNKMNKDNGAPAIFANGCKVNFDKLSTEELLQTRAMVDAWLKKEAKKASKVQQEGAKAEVQAEAEEEAEAEKAKSKGKAKSMRKQQAKAEDANSKGKGAAAKSKGDLEKAPKSPKVLQEAEDAKKKASAKKQKEQEEKEQEEKAKKKRLAAIDVAMELYAKEKQDGGDDGDDGAPKKKKAKITSFEEQIDKRVALNAELEQQLKDECAEIEKLDMEVQQKEAELTAVKDAVAEAKGKVKAKNALAKRLNNKLIAGRNKLKEYTDKQKKAAENKEVKEGKDGHDEMDLDTEDDNLDESDDEHVNKRVDVEKEAADLLNHFREVGHANLADTMVELYLKHLQKK